MSAPLNKQTEQELWSKVHELENMMDFFFQHTDKEVLESQRVVDMLRNLCDARNTLKSFILCGDTGDITRS